MKKQISENLVALEKKHDIRIFYACETGSRAWGFASKDSDYDIRFSYIHRQEWYLGIQNKKHAIDPPIKNVEPLNELFRDSLQISWQKARF